MSLKLKAKGRRKMMGDGGSIFLRLMKKVISV